VAGTGAGRATVGLRIDRVALWTFRIDRVAADEYYHY